MAVTIRDIAERLNLSKSTVSYALNGGPKPVSEDVRHRVEKAAREMGFRRNEVARSLAMGRTHTIGFVPLSLQRHALTSPYARTALDAVYVAAEDHGLHILLPTGYNPSDPESTRDRLFEARVDGVVLISPTDDTTMLEYLRESSIPMASVASHMHDICPCFNADNAEGARSIVDHLVGLGHRKIAVVTNDLRKDVQDRYSAFRGRMSEHGLTIPDSFVEYGDLLPDAGYSAGYRLLTLPNRPTAVFCANDQMAYGFIHAARELGIDVPRQLSVVGFDDDELSATFSPSLTTVIQPVAEMAKAAFEAVVRQIAGEPVASKIFPARLIVRASTRPTQDNYCNE